LILERDRTLLVRRVVRKETITGMKIVKRKNTMVKVVPSFLVVKTHRLKAKNGMNINKTLGRLCKNDSKNFSRLFLCVVFGDCKHLFDDSN
jgi:hypothetical protein